MPSNVAWTFLATLCGALIISIVTLAFRRPSSYSKLYPGMLLGLGMALVGYGGYALGYTEGAKWASEQIEIVGEPTFSAWPIMFLVGAFTVLTTLLWLPDYLGFTDQRSGSPPP